jgi:uncharacterized protein YndB with AHSA1/START domain
MANENNTADHFIIKKTYKAPITLVWQALTDSAMLKEWYFDFAADFKLEVGAVFEWEAGEPNGKQWLHRGQMLEIVPQQKLVHTWEYPGYSGSSTLCWELTPVDEAHTQIVLTHTFDVPFDENEAALRKVNFETGWNHIINISLTDYLNRINP